MAEAYPSNSNKAKESSLIREPVDQHPVQSQQVDAHPRREAIETPKRRISPVKEVFAAIFPGGMQELKEHLVWDIFVPWAQDMLHSGWQGLGDVIFPGSNRTSNQKMPERVSYDSRYKIDVAPYPSTSYGSSRYNESPIFRTKEEAEAALRDLREIWLRYRIVTLLDFNERVGNETRPTQNNYGWLSLDAARIEHFSGGWILVMPRAVAIDNYR